jgi:predicted amidohydrolase
MSTLRIALAALPFPSSPDDALARVDAAITEAAAGGAAVVCFPECYLPGYRALGAPVPPPDPAFFARAHCAVAAAAGRSRLTVVLGTERFVEGALRITALVVGPDGVPLGWQDKVQLDPSEESLYQPGTARKVFSVGPLRFGGVDRSNRLPIARTGRDLPLRRAHPRAPERRRPPWVNHAPAPSGPGVGSTCNR